LKVVNDDLLGEVCSSLQLHGAARTVRQALVQCPLDVRRVVYAVWWWDHHCVTARPDGSGQKHRAENQQQNAHASHVYLPEIKLELNCVIGRDV